ncbi:MAG: O-antigen ligase family protein [Candidatus Omnitrophota bacterium]
MTLVLLILIFIRPLIASLAFPVLNAIYSPLLLLFLAAWIIVYGLKTEAIRPIQYPLFLFILALLVSVLSSQNIGLSISCLDKYALAILIMVIVSSLKKETDTIISCLLFTSFLVSCLAFYQYIFGFQRVLTYMAKNNIYDPFSWEYIAQRRVFFPFVTPNTLAGYLSMMLPLALTKRNRFIFILPLTLALLLTRSLGGISSAAAAILLYFCLTKKFNAKIIAGMAALAIGTILVVLAIRSSAVKTHFQPAFSAVMRINYWRETLRIIWAHPLLGIGLGNFNIAYSRFSHNSYLQIWAEMGILGIVSFLWIVWSFGLCALKNIKKSRNNIAIACLAAAGASFCLHNFLDFSFFLPEVSLLWWIICGLLLAVNTAGA